MEQSDLKSNPPAEIKAAFLESHDKQNLTVSDEFQLKPKVFSNALPFKPLQAKASSSGMGSMFGGRRKPSIQPILPPKLGAFLGSSTLSSSSEVNMVCLKGLASPLSHVEMTACVHLLYTQQGMLVDAIPMRWCFWILLKQCSRAFTVLK